MNINQNLIKKPHFIEGQIKPKMYFVVPPFDIVKGTDIQGFILAKDLWEYLESNKSYNDWIEGMLTKYDFVADIDYSCCREKAEASDEILVEYILPIDTAKKLAKIENNDKGYRWLQKLSDREIIAEWSEYRVCDWYINGTLLSRKSGIPLRKFLRSKVTRKFRESMTKDADIETEKQIEIPVSRSGNEPVWMHPYLAYNFMLRTSQLCQIIERAMFSKD